MKCIFIVVALFILTSFAVIAQNKSGLEVKGYEGKVTRYISEGSKICVITNGEKYRGNFKVLSDKAILISSDTILVSQIQELRAQTSSSQIGGIALVVPGSIIGGLGLVGIGVGIAEGGYGLIAAILVTPIAGIAIFGAIKGVQLLSRGKKFSSSKWKYTITAIPPRLK